MADRVATLPIVKCKRGGWLSMVDISYIIYSTSHKGTSKLEGGVVGHSIHPPPPPPPRLAPISLITINYVQVALLILNHCITHKPVTVPLRKSIGSEIGLLRPPPLSISSAHTFTVSPSPKVLLAVEFASWITAPELNHNHGI